MIYIVCAVSQVRVSRPCVASLILSESVLSLSVTRHGGIDYDIFSAIIKIHFVFSHTRTSVFFVSRVGGGRRAHAAGRRARPSSYVAVSIVS